MPSKSISVVFNKGYAVHITYRVMFLQPSAPAEITIEKLNSSCSENHIYNSPRQSKFIDLHFNQMASMFIFKCEPR